MITKDELKNRMFYHRPSEEQAKRHRAVQESAWAFAQEVLANTPPGRAQSLAFTKLEEAKMWANAAIAHEAGTETVDPVSQT